MKSSRIGATAQDLLILTGNILELRLSNETMPEKSGSKISWRKCKRFTFAYFPQHLRF